jgi:hypothetical protein
LNPHDFVTQRKPLMINAIFQFRIRTGAIQRITRKEQKDFKADKKHVRTFSSFNQTKSMLTQLVVEILTCVDLI